MNTLLIECGILFLIIYLILKLICDCDPVIIIILSLMICYIYYSNHITKLENFEDQPKEDKQTKENNQETKENEQTKENNEEKKEETKKIVSNNFKINNNNTDGTLKFFSDKNIKKPIKASRNTNIINKSDNNIAKQNTRNQFQSTENNTDNKNETVEDISIEGVKADDIITNENKFDKFGGFIDANSIYVPRDYKYTKDDYGYNFIPPLNWIDLPNYGPIRVPLCVSANGNCQVHATHTTGYPAYVKEWNESRKIMGPDNIDIIYIQDHLNTSKPPEQINN